EGPELVKALRIGNDRRARIEGKAIIGVDIGTPTGLVPLFENGRLDAGTLQPDRQREAAKAGANDCCGLGIGHVVSEVRRGFSRRQASARCTGTGGLPIRMRAISAGVVSPA